MDWRVDFVLASNALREVNAPAVQLGLTTTAGFLSIFVLFFVGFLPAGANELQETSTLLRCLATNSEFFITNYSKPSLSLKASDDWAVKSNATL